MEGWRQRRIGSNQKLQGGKTKTVLTLTGLLMEGLGRKVLPICLKVWMENGDGDPFIDAFVISYHHIEGRN
jgi:hypothetical protein